MIKKPHKKGLVVEVRDGNISSALKKFKRKVDDSNKLIDVVKNSHYEKMLALKQDMDKHKDTMEAKKIDQSINRIKKKSVK